MAALEKVVCPKCETENVGEYASPRRLGGLHNRTQQVSSKKGYECLECRHRWQVVVG